MDRDDIFGDIFERVEEVWMGVVFIILYWFKWSVYEI